MNHRTSHRIATSGVALGSLMLLALLVLPVAMLVMRGGGDGVRQLGSDPELRASLALTAFTATAARIDQTRAEPCQPTNWTTTFAA